jgi:hypothetical protein
MPIALQKRVVEYLFGNAEKANAWARILVANAYSISGKPEMAPVRYEAGQPMGAYSSWPIMALTHHIIVQVAAARAGRGGSTRRPFGNYCLLGDDLVIGDDSVAEQYKKLLITLGMDYSPEKTHTSPNVFEFAKRWFLNEEEITGFSVSGLQSVWKSYPLLHNFLCNQKSHGWDITIERQPDLILAIHKEMHGDKFIYERTLRSIKLYRLFNETLTLKGRNKTGYPGILNVLSECFGLDLLTFSESQCWDSSVDIIELIYIEAKRNLVEKDLQYFQKGVWTINARLNQLVTDRIEAARVDQATGEFLKETLSTVLNWNHPMVHCLNRLIDQSTEFLMKYWDPEQSLDFLMEQGLSKYYVSEGVFSMRTCHSIILAESAILKEILAVTTKVIGGGLVPTINEEGFTVLTPRSEKT